MLKDVKYKDKNYDNKLHIDWGNKIKILLMLCSYKKVGNKNSNWSMKNS